MPATTLISGSRFLSILTLICAACLSTSQATVAQSKAQSLEKKAQKAAAEKNTDEAIKLWREAERLYRKNDDPQSAIKILDQLGKTYMHQFKIDSAQYYYKACRDLAQSHKLKTAYVEALNSLSAIFAYKGEQDSTIRLANEILSIQDLDHSYISDAHTSLGNIFESRFEYDKVEYHLKKAIEIDSINRDSASLPFNYTALARLRGIEAKNNEALNILLKSVTYLRGNIDKFKYATIYAEIARVFYTMNNALKSREYALKSLEICEEMGLKTTRIEALLVLASNEERDNNYEKALKYYFEAEDISVRKNKKRATINIHLGIAACYLQLDRLDIVKERLDKASALITDSKNASLRLKYDYVNSIYQLQSGNKSAFSNVIAVLDKADNSGAIYLAKHLSGALASSYAKASDYRSAYRYLTRFNMLKDSIFRLQQSLMAQDLEARYQKKEQETQIELLAAENTIKTTRLKQQSMLIWGTGLALLIFGFLLFVIFRFNKSLKSQKAIVEKSLHEKNVLLREIHHRVKNNLQVISSLLALQSKYIQDNSALDALQQGQDRVHSMALIHEDLYRSENLKGVDTEIYFEQLVDNLFESYNIHEDRVELEMDVEAITLDVDTMIPLGLILNELVSNALKHAFKNDSKGVIKVSLKESGQRLILTVKDNGSDIQNTDEIDGKSFGYELVKAFARKLKAELDIYVDNGLGIRMTINQYQKAA